SLAVLEGTSVNDALPLRTAALPLVVFVGIDTLGYLSALLYWAYTPWALLLLVVPVVTILVAARAVTRARDSERRSAGLFAIARETLERQRLVAEMTRMARFDPLTGLANRALYADRLAHALDLSRRGHGTVAVLYCDLDGFKGVNDRFGHDVGDQVLGEVGR